jgi:hypothetical protein
VVVKPAPGSTLEVIGPPFALDLLVVALDAPTPLGEAN